MGTESEKLFPATHLHKLKKSDDSQHSNNRERVSEFLTETVFSEELYSVTEVYWKQNLAQILA